MLIATADWRVQPLGKFHRGVDGPANNHTGTIQHDWELGLRQHPCGFGQGGVSACWALELDDGWQVDVNHLCPEITRYIDLRRGRGAFCLQDHTVQRFGDA